MNIPKNPDCQKYPQSLILKFQIFAFYGNPIMSIESKLIQTIRKLTQLSSRNVKPQEQVVNVYQERMN